MVSPNQSVSNPKDRLETILERALTAYHRDERHGGARWIGERLLDAELVPIAREAFRDADDLPSDREVLSAIAEPMQLLGEGYHVMALAEPRRRFVVKYAKHRKPVPPLAAPPPSSRHEWAHEHGIRADGSLHPAIWQHIRAFEAYGPLAVASRVYIADSALPRLCNDERRLLERFGAIGIVRSLGPPPQSICISYPDDFPQEKRAPEGLAVSVVIVQPLVTPLAAAIERALRTDDVAAARDLEARYDEFTQQLWRCGVPHLDFSILNIGIVGSGASDRLQIFDPHIGVIDDASGGREVRDPMSVDPSSLETILRSSRDGSRWALWRVQQDVSASDDAPPQAPAAAATLVREFHARSEGIEEGRGAFGVERFDRTWRQRRMQIVNTVMHAQLWALIRHPLGDLIRSLLDPAVPDGVYDRSVAVQAMEGGSPLPQFRAGLRVYGGRPLLVVANIAEHASTLVKHWGRLRLPEELDVQDDPAIHYHLRDLFTGEMYVRPGDDLAGRGFVVGLAPHELHVLEVEDISVEDMAAERLLAAHRDVSEFLGACTKRVGVVGDVHGELQALKDIVRALGFINAFDHWSARDGTLVFTGDIGHGRHLQEVFDFIHRLAAQAHRVGGRIVWTLGNHDLYLDREGGQGGEESLGYRLWPSIRESALHPERHPGLTVQAAYFEHDKLFVHGGILPNIVELSMRERGTGDAESVASYINDVLRHTLVDRERISARDLPHEIFHIGTSHTRERRMPGEIGYEPAGVFTPDLREVDHYRYHADLLPQVVGHTASRQGEIRYSPGSWLRREYIAIDVGRQHGTGNGGLLLTDFGWVAVTPGGPARFVEVAPLFVEVARQAESAAAHPRHDGAGVKQILSAYLEMARGKPRTLGDVQRALFTDLSPAQVVTIERFLETVRQTGQCLAITDLDEMLTAFSGNDTGEDTVELLAEYLRAGGGLVFRADTAFDWFYVRLLRPLVVELGPRSPLLSNVVLMLSGGAVFAFEDGAFRRIVSGASRDGSAGLDVLAADSKERLEGMPVLDPSRTVYIGDSTALGGIDPALAGHVGFVIDVGDAMPDPAGEPLTGLHHSYRRTIDTIVTTTAAMRESGRMVAAPEPPDAEAGETVLWTFEQPRFPPGRRVRVRVGGSGFVHAGVAGANGRWTRVYNVPLVPLAEPGYEALLPAGVNVFTFFWTEAPWARGRPGHWERGPGGATVFRTRGE
ncbi:MAG TPA: metallophosphoesterase [Vicinamibacterales bacterium]|nr:metallophosphoesterase [Vicinamibacterales bacterium]